MSKKITVDDILTSSGRYKDRKDSSECTQEVKDNATALCPKVNVFLDELGYTGNRDISSGFRTSGSNSSTSNAGKKSSHLQAKAVDIIDDKDQTLAKLSASREDLLKKHGLYMEHPSKTIGERTNWLHLSDRAPGSGKHIFYP